jgi:8-oxo-dGTP pyrophosphatase MutT (NUDIX family)
MSVSSTFPHGVEPFFAYIYGQKPELIEDKKNTVYGLPGKGISIILDKFRGCHIDIKETPADSARVRNAIFELADTAKASKAFNSIWVDFALPTNPTALALLPPSFVMGEAGKGDLIYDYQMKKMRVWQWLNTDIPCAIPPGATHNIGATALMIDTAAKKVLLVVNVMRNNAWNMPGGSFDVLQDKTPADTSLREAQEEGGFTLPSDITLVSKIVGQSQFPNNQFAPAINQTWAHLCDGLSAIALNPPANEIVTAQWVSVDEVLNSKGSLNGYKVSEEITAMLSAAMRGQGFDLIADKGFMVVHAPK